MKKNLIRFSKYMETSNPLSMSGHISMIQTLIYENKQRRRKAMLTESEKAQGSETNPYIFVGQPKTYILKIIRLA